jgi:hypothetical protein
VLARFEVSTSLVSVILGFWVVTLSIRFIGSRTRPMKVEVLSFETSGISKPASLCNNPEFCVVVVVINSISRDMGMYSFRTDFRRIFNRVIIPKPVTCVRHDAQSSVNHRRLVASDEDLSGQRRELTFGLG